MTENKGLKIREGRTYLDVQSGKDIISFVAPAFGPNNYVNVANEIAKAGLKSPTMNQTASLTYGAWQNPEEKYSNDIIKKMKSNWLWAFNGLLYIPNEGIYIQDRPEIKDNRVFMDKNDLSKKLESNDTSVRFVSFDSFKTGGQTPLQLAKNPFVQALAGEEGADKLAQIADKYRNNPYVNTLDKNNVTQPITRVAGLYSGRDLGGSRLLVDGDYWGDYSYGGGCAFGVSE